MTVKHERQMLRQARMDREERDYAQHTRNAKLAALVTPELAALLERLADYARQAAYAAKGCPDDVDGAYINEETAHTFAACIREALALEANDA